MVVKILLLLILLREEIGWREGIVVLNSIGMEINLGIGLSLIFLLSSIPFYFSNNLG